MLKKLECAQQIFEKYANIKFHENPVRSNRVVPCGRTDMTKLIVAFRNFAKAPKQRILASSRSSQYIRIPTNSVRRTKQKSTIKFSRISEWYTKLIRQKLRYSFPNFQGIMIVWLMFVTDVPSHNYARMSLCQYCRKLKGKSLCVPNSCIEKYYIYNVRNPTNAHR
jgi:hypothetical protein